MNSKILVFIFMPVITLTSGLLFSHDDVSNRQQSARIFHAEVGDTVKFDKQQALKNLRKKIQGKEEMPASEVFENIKVFKKVTAGRLLRIMEMGFAKSLGVNCTHCHNPDNWAGEEKAQKQIARDMMAMAGKINDELLSSIENLESEKPTINCTTCHRGEVKPALNLEDKNPE